MSNGTRRDNSHGSAGSGPKAPDAAPQGDPARPPHVLWAAAAGGLIGGLIGALIGSGLG